MEDHPRRNAKRSRSEGEDPVLFPNEARRRIGGSSNRSPSRGAIVGGPSRQPPLRQDEDMSPAGGHQSPAGGPIAGRAALPPLPRQGDDQSPVDSPIVGRAAPPPLPCKGDDQSPAGSPITGCAALLPLPSGGPQVLASRCCRAAPAPRTRDSWRIPCVLDLPDDVLIDILNTTDGKTVARFGSCCKKIRDLVRCKKVACKKYMLHPPRDPELQVNRRSEGIMTIRELTRDVLLYILTKLDTFDLACLARACKFFRSLIASPDAWRFIRRNTDNATILGVLVTKPISMYPSLLGCFLPWRQRRAATWFADFWKNVARRRQLRNVEVADARDGRILIREGDTTAKKFVVFRPMSQCSSFFLPPAPMDSSGTKMYYVGSAVISDDHGYRFSVIVLANNQADNSALASANKVLVSRFLSTEGLWFCQNTVAAAPVPSGSSIRPPSVLAGKILHFLQPNMQIITIDVDKLTLGSIRFPPCATLHKDNHVLVETMNGMLSLAVVSTGVIDLYTYKPDSCCWSLPLKLQGPGDATNTQVIGSGRGTLLVNGGDRVYSMNLTDGCCEEVTTRSNLLQYELVYELEFPPAYDILR